MCVWGGNGLVNPFSLCKISNYKFTKLWCMKRS